MQFYLLTSLFQTALKTGHTPGLDGGCSEGGEKACWLELLEACRLNPVFVGVGKRLLNQRPFHNARLPPTTWGIQVSRRPLPRPLFLGISSIRISNAECVARCPT